MIQIRVVDKFNFWDVGELTSNKDGIATVLEEYVCCNAFSIAESHFYPEYKPHALYQGEILIGFFMYKILEDKPQEAFICRFMLDHKFIGQGLGNQSFFAIIKYLKGSGVNRISLGLDDENNIAKKVYMNHGFKFTNKIVDGEHIYAIEF